MLDIDINDNMCYGPTHKLMALLGTQEMILDHHSDLSPPTRTWTETKCCNPSMVYGLLPSFPSKLSAISNLAGPWDYPALWINTHFHDAFGDVTLNTVCPSIWRCKANNPCLTHHYSTQTTACINHEFLLKIVCALPMAMHKDGLIGEHLKEYQDIEIIVNP